MLYRIKAKVYEERHKITKIFVTMFLVIWCFTHIYDFYIEDFINF